MSTSERKPREAKSPPTSSTVILLLGDIADTSWRMFVPTIGGALAGWWIDGRLHSSPWCSLGGLAIGVIVTTMLVRQQLKKVDNDK